MKPNLWAGCNVIYKFKKTIYSKKYNFVLFIIFLFAHSLYKLQKIQISFSLIKENGIYLLKLNFKSVKLILKGKKENFLKILSLPC